LNICDKVRKLL